MTGVRTRTAAGLLAALFFAPAARPDDPDPIQVLRAFEQAAAQATARAERCVVSIGRLAAAPQLPPLGVFGQRPSANQPDWRELFGAGVLLKPPGRDRERLVLTNRHVVIDRSASRSGAPRQGLIVVLPDRIQVPAEVIAADPRSDLAVLRMDLSNSGVRVDELPALEFGAAEEFQKGQFALLLGNPYAVARDGSASVSLATIANISRAPWNGLNRPQVDQDLTVHHLGTLWHLDSRIQLGGSGGAVVDFEGRLIGLTTSLAAIEGYESSVGYAVPMTRGMRRVVDSLLEGYEVEYGFLGIAPRSFGRFGGFAAPLRGPARGAEIDSVALGSPADVAELRSGDVVNAVNGSPIRTEDDLIREIGLLGPDGVAVLDINRAGARGGASQVEVRLGKWPVYDDTAIIATRMRTPAWRGLNIDFPTARRRYITTNLFERYPQAVVVTSVVAGSPAAAAGLQEGLFVASVNGEPVQTPAEFAAAITRVAGAARLQLDDGREFTVGE